MKLEKQIYQLLWEIPYFFTDRTDILQFLFLDQSDYRWEKGELREPSHKKKTLRADGLPDFVERLNGLDPVLNSNPVDIFQYNTQWLAQAQAKVLAARQNIEKAVDTIHPGDDLCVLSDLANLWQIPDNVKNDWLGGAQETVELILCAVRTRQEKNGEDLSPAEIRTLHARNFAMAKRAQQCINLLNQR